MFFPHQSNRSIRSTFSFVRLLLSWEHCLSVNFHSLCVQSGSTISTAPVYKCLIICLFKTFYVSIFLNCYVPVPIKKVYVCFCSIFSSLYVKSESRHQPAASLKGAGDPPNLNQAIDLMLFNACTAILNTIFKSKMDYYSNPISEAGNDNKALFRSIDCLVYKKAEKSFPTS